MNDSAASRGVVLIALVAIVFGSALRFTNLDRKPFWHDEAHTALRVSGFTWMDFWRGAVRDAVVTPRELLAFQRPAEGAGLRATLHALKSRPEHPPLYFLSARAGYLVSDDAQVATRLPAALWGVLLLPAVYWLWRELFGAGPGAWIAASLAAVSPLQVIYSQEAREYSLWTMLCIASTAALAFARRRNDAAGWIAYGLLVTLGLHTHVLFGALVLTHLAWIALESRGDWHLRSRALMALGGAVLLFLPWATLLHRSASHVAQVMSWLRTPDTLWSLAWHLERTVARGFVDPAEARWIALPTLALVAAAVARLVRLGRHPAQRLLLLAIAGTVAPVVVPDLLLGGQATHQSRYLLAAMAFVTVTVGFAVDAWMRHDAKWPRQLGHAIWIALLVVGGYSSLEMVRAENWWNKALTGDNVATARTLGAAPQPLLIVEDGGTSQGNSLSLAHAVDDHVRFLMLREGQQPAPGQLSGDVFVLDATPAMLDFLAAQGRVTFVDSEHRLAAFQAPASN